MTDFPEAVFPPGVAAATPTDSSRPEALHYHLMGAGGIGMSAFARLLSAQGHRVSGCDEHVTDLTARLSQ